MTDLLEAALGYARQGLRVHPCRAGDKKPLTRWGSQATTAEYIIRMWWTRWPDAMIAVCTGNGLVVVDVDPRHGAEQDVEACEETLTVTTPGGGWHHYYHASQPVPNAVGLLPGVDIRGDGGYVIAPPSPGYAFLNQADVAPLPMAFLDAMADRASERRRSGGFEPPAAGSIGEGYRHDYMVRFAGWAIAVLEIDDPDELAQACIEEYQRACSPADAPDRNIRRIAHSIWRQDQRG
jgi:hypothetical protein